MTEEEWKALSDSQKMLAIMDEEDRFTDVYHEAIMEQGAESEFRESNVIWLSSIQVDENSVERIFQ